MFTPQPGQIRIATPADLRFIDSTQKKFADCVGFLPTVALEQSAEGGHIRICCENGDAAGYVLSRPHLSWQPKMRSITQTCVCMDAQRRHHGLALLKTIETEALDDGLLAIQACCAVGLESNEFWRAAGFIPIVHMTPATKSQREIICWRKPLTKVTPIWFAFPPERSGHRAKPTITDYDRHRTQQTAAAAQAFMTPKIG